MKARDIWPAGHGTNVMNPYRPERMPGQRPEMDIAGLCEHDPQGRRSKARRSPRRRGIVSVPVDFRVTSPELRRDFPGSRSYRP